MADQVTSQRDAGLRRASPVRAALRPHGEAELVRERFCADPSGWLPAPAKPRGRQRWLVELEVAGVHRTVLMEVGEVWRVGTARWRACAWWPVDESGDVLEGSRWLPRFQGSLGFTGEPSSRLVLHGSYDPPFGRAGRLLDKLLLGRLARRSARNLLRQLAQRLVSGE